MIFFEIIKSWKESLITFKLENLKLLFLASLKRFLVSFSLSFKICVLTVLISIFFLLAINNTFLSLLASFIIYVCFPALLIMVVRPSIEIKDINYFISYSRWLFIIFINSLIFFSMMAYLVASLYGIDYLLAAEGLPVFMYNIPLIFRIIIKSILLVSMLFFFDSKGTFIDFFNALSRGIKAIIWYLPVFVFFCGIMIGFNLICYLNDLTGFGGFSQYLILDLFLYLLTLILAGILKLFIFSIFAIFYTKIKHSNFSLFY